LKHLQTKNTFPGGGISGRCLYRKAVQASPKAFEEEAGVARHEGGTKGDAEEEKERQARAIQGRGKI